MKTLFRLFLILLFLAAVSAGGLYYFFGPVSSSSQPEVFIIPQDENVIDVVLKLKEQNLIKNKEAFGLLYLFFAKTRQVLPGGYRLNQNMNAWQIVDKISQKPDLLWVTIREGLRKEQIAIVLADALGWSDKQKGLWIDQDTTNNPEYYEGVYFPDTYLIPIDEGGEDIAKRFINRFNEKMAPLFPKFAAKDIKWTTGVKIASLIQREAGGTSDMALISGIIWNRLDKGMKLEIDATLQYIKGPSTSSGQDGSWWGKVLPIDKQLDSPFNTYLNKGLPPTPIANPGLPAIEAALNPETTDCLYYLHDSNRQIHCAKTYAQHLENIKKFL